MKTKLKNKLYSNPGSKTQDIYVRHVTDDGEPDLVVKEIKNLYAEIQTYKDDNDIYKILAKVSGDISKLDFNKGVYIDVSQIPSNYNDLMNMSYQLQSDFDSLPINYKQAMNSNFNIYYGLAMSGKLDDFIKSVDKKQDFQKFIDSKNFNFNQIKTESESLKNQSVKGE